MIRRHDRTPRMRDLHRARMAIVISIALVAAIMILGLLSWR